MDGRDPDRRYVETQYADARRLAVRQEAHRLWAEDRGFDLAEFVVERLRLRPGDRVLDVGYGNGLYLPAYRRRGARVLACDLSPGILRDAPPGAAPVVGDALRLPLAGGSVDAAGAHHVLFHVPDPVAAMREIRRVLAPGGRVAFATNGAEAMEPLRSIHGDVARATGLRPLPFAMTRFTLEDLATVREVFPDAGVDRHDDALVFPDAATALRYYESGPFLRVEGDPDPAAREALLAGVRERIEAIVRREGAFRVVRSAGCFRAGGR